MVLDTQISLMDSSYHQIEELLAGWGETGYRVKQVYGWLQKGVRPDEMLNIPRALREKLMTVPFGGSKIIEKRLSALDGTLKYLFKLEDGGLAEGVLMRYHHGNTLCISTQIGCRMGCAFCASTLEGLVRNLTPGEMLSFILEVEKDEGSADGKRAVTNLVLMGSGEPLDNFDNVVQFLKRVTSPDGLMISQRNISLSTCGLVPEIRRLIADAPHITLCISLHAHSDAVRDTLVPVNKKYPINELLIAAREYTKSTGRRVIFEYALIENLNASQEDAYAFAKLLKGTLCHVNLIPLNDVPERALTGVSRKAAAQFAAWLKKKGISATLRREMGADIEGACGQLRRRVLKEDGG